ncbi:RNA-binding cell elongation regulator Jag/EloR [Maridesulfovibrio ferrireducens]|uniref:RNA-binding cell elongation regulator Jag/EloR n=1 Tax=Maridesulfovibrio ferrireducens TaxID=246191 RepID=UPI001A2F80E8|nr:Jag N-terminal domain-containing protein [Maridesulfovibrio ferrireducens]
MSEFKEFQGKNLDEAINNACDYFNLNRDKLEIEILSGGSTGVFGLVGKKNAKVKARPRGGESRSLLNNETKPERAQSARYEKPVERPVERKPEPVEKKVEQEAPVVREETAIAPRAEVETPAVKRESVVAVREESVVPAVSESKSEAVDADTDTDSSVNEGFRERRSIMEADPEDIAAAVREALERMIEPIVQQPPKLEIEVGEDRVNVLVDDEENSGLIIGREGQTLSSLQYLCNRMVSKKLQTSVRVQIDTGDYRERQDEKLRQLAWHLADKAMHTGRVQSTKPLSSYHRRVVHMALQEDKHVNTRSKGDGPMKRVLILPRRSRAAGGRGGERTERPERSEGYTSQPTDRYNSRGSDSYNSRGSERSSERGPARGPERDSARGPERGAPRGPERGDARGPARGPERGSARGPERGAPRGPVRNDSRGEARGPERSRPRTGERNDNYGRGRTENTAPRGRGENYGNRPPQDENFGNRAPRDENFGNRAPRDENFGNRAPKTSETRRTERTGNSSSGNTGGYNDDRYNRY